MEREQPAPWEGCWLKVVVVAAADGGLESYGEPFEWFHRSTHPRRVAWGGGCWREIKPWGIAGLVPTASLEFLSVAGHVWYT